MRSVLALCVLIALCASANAAARGHLAKSRHVIVRPSQTGLPSYATPDGVRIHRDDSVPGGLRTDHDDPPDHGGGLEHAGEHSNNSLQVVDITAISELNPIALS